MHAALSARAQIGQRDRVGGLETGAPGFEFDRRDHAGCGGRVQPQGHDQLACQCPKREVRYVHLGLRRRNLGHQDGHIQITAITHHRQQTRRSLFQRLRTRRLHRQQTGAAGPQEGFKVDIALGEIEEIVVRVDAVILAAVPIAKGARGGVKDRVAVPWQPFDVALEGLDEFAKADSVE